MHFDFTDLRLFLRVSEAGSITAGAERAHLALASASARIRGMEEMLGVALLERGRRGVRPTPAGQALVHHARILLGQLEAMRGELGEYARGLAGHVRLWCNTAAFAEFLPEALAGYLAANPSIDVDVEEQPSHAIVRAVAAGRADVGIFSDTVDAGPLETFPFRIDRLVVVARRGHKAARRGGLAFHDVLKYPMVGLGPGSALQDHLADHAMRAGLPLKLRVRLSGFDAICRLVEQGVGIAIVPEVAARRCAVAMAIGVVRLRDAWALRRLTIGVRRLDALPLHARRLVEHLVASEKESGSPRAASRMSSTGSRGERTGRQHT